VPVSPRHAAGKRTLLRVEFATFSAALISVPCQIVRGGMRWIQRLLSRNPRQGTFLRLLERLRGCSLLRGGPEVAVRMPRSVPGIQP